MTNENATWWGQAGRSAWPRTFGIVLSCAVAAFAIESTTAAYAQMGENAITSRLEITPPTNPVQRYCTLGTACGDDGALAGPFGGVWRDGAVVEPGPRTFAGVRFIGKSVSVEDPDEFDVYCSTEGGEEDCARVERTVVDDDNDASCGIIEVVNSEEDACTKDFDYMIEWGKAQATTILRTCKVNVKATCQNPASALVENGQIVAYRALFDYDCVRYCYGGCCRF